MKYLIILFILIIGCSSVLPPTAYKEESSETVELLQEDWWLVVDHAKDLSEFLDQLNSSGILSKLEAEYPGASEFIKQIQDLIDSILFVRVR